MSRPATREGGASSASLPSPISSSVAVVRASSSHSTSSTSRQQLRELKAGNYLGGAGMHCKDRQDLVTRLRAPHSALPPPTTTSKKESTNRSPRRAITNHSGNDKNTNKVILPPARRPATHSGHHAENNKKNDNKQLSIATPTSLNGDKEDGEPSPTEAAAAIRREMEERARKFEANLDKQRYETSRAIADRSSDRLQFLRGKKGQRIEPSLRAKLLVSIAEDLTHTLDADPEGMLYNYCRDAEIKNADKNPDDYGSSNLSFIEEALAPSASMKEATETVTARTQLAIDAINTSRGTGTSAPTASDVRGPRKSVWNTMSIDEAFEKFRATAAVSRKSSFASSAGGSSGAASPKSSDGGSGLLRKLRGEQEPNTDGTVSAVAGANDMNMSMHSPEYKEEQRRRRIDEQLRAEPADVDVLREIGLKLNDQVNFRETLLLESRKHGGVLTDKLDHTRFELRMFQDRERTGEWGDKRPLHHDLVHVREERDWLYARMHHFECRVRAAEAIMEEAAKRESQLQAAETYIETLETDNSTLRAKLKHVMDTMLARIKKKKMEYMRTIRLCETNTMSAYDTLGDLTKYTKQLERDRDRLQNYVETQNMSRPEQDAANIVSTVTSRRESAGKWFLPHRATIDRLAKNTSSTVLETLDASLPATTDLTDLRGVCVALLEYIFKCMSSSHTETLNHVMVDLAPYIDVVMGSKLAKENSKDPVYQMVAKKLRPMPDPQQTIVRHMAEDYRRSWGTMSRGLGEFMHDLVMAFQASLDAAAKPQGDEPEAQATVAPANAKDVDELVLQERARAREVTQLLFNEKQALLSQIENMEAAAKKATEEYSALSERMMYSDESLIDAQEHARLAEQELRSLRDSAATSTTKRLQRQVAQRDALIDDLQLQLVSVSRTTGYALDVDLLRSKLKKLADNDGDTCSGASNSQPGSARMLSPTGMESAGSPRGFLSCMLDSSTSNTKATDQSVQTTMSWREMNAMKATLEEQTQAAKDRLKSLETSQAKEKKGGGRTPRKNTSLDVEEDLSKSVRKSPREKSLSSKGSDEPSELIKFVIPGTPPLSATPRTTTTDMAKIVDQRQRRPSTPKPADLPLGNRLKVPEGGLADSTKKSRPMTGNPTAPTAGASPLLSPRTKGRRSSLSARPQRPKMDDSTRATDSSVDAGERSFDTRDMGVTCDLLLPPAGLYALESRPGSRLRLLMESPERDDDITLRDVPDDVSSLGRPPTASSVVGGTRVPFAARTPSRGTLMSQLESSPMMTTDNNLRALSANPERVAQQPVATLRAQYEHQINNLKHVVVSLQQQLQDSFSNNSLLRKERAALEQRLMLESRKAHRAVTSAHAESTFVRERERVMHAQHVTNIKDHFNQAVSELHNKSEEQARSLKRRTDHLLHKKNLELQRALTAKKKGVGNSAPGQRPSSVPLGSTPGGASLDCPLPRPLPTPASAQSNATVVASNSTPPPGGNVDSRGGGTAGLERSGSIKLPPHQEAQHAAAMQQVRASIQELEDDFESERATLLSRLNDLRSTAQSATGALSRVTQEKEESDDRIEELESIMEYKHQAFVKSKAEYLMKQKGLEQQVAELKRKLAEERQAQQEQQRLIEEAARNHAQARSVSPDPPVMIAVVDANPRDVPAMDYVIQRHETTASLATLSDGDGTSPTKQRRQFRGDDTTPRRDARPTSATRPATSAATGPGALSQFFVETDPFEANPVTPWKGIARSSPEKAMVAPRVAPVLKSVGVQAEIISAKTHVNPSTLLDLLSHCAAIVHPLVGAVKAAVPPPEDDVNGMSNSRRALADPPAVPTSLDTTGRCVAEVATMMKSLAEWVTQAHMHVVRQTTRPSTSDASFLGFSMCGQHRRSTATPDSRRPSSVLGATIVSSDAGSTAPSIRRTSSAHDLSSVINTNQGHKPGGGTHMWAPRASTLTVSSMLLPPKNNTTDTCEDEHRQKKGPELGRAPPTAPPAPKTRHYLKRERELGQIGMRAEAVVHDKWKVKDDAHAQARLAAFSKKGEKVLTDPVRPSSTSMSRGHSSSSMKKGVLR